MNTGGLPVAFTLTGVRSLAQHHCTGVFALVLGVLSHEMRETYSAHVGLSLRTLVDIANLTLDFIRVLIWPLVVIFLAVILRHRIQDLLSRMTSAEAMGARAEFAIQSSLANDLAGPDTNENETTTPENITPISLDSANNSQASVNHEPAKSRFRLDKEDLHLIRRSSTIAKNEIHRIIRFTQHHNRQRAIDGISFQTRKHLAEICHAAGIPQESRAIDSPLPDALGILKPPMASDENAWSAAISLARTIHKREAIIHDTDYEPTSSEVYEYARDMLRLLERLEQLTNFLVDASTQKRNEMRRSR